MLTNLTAHLAGKLIVDCMTWTCGYDASLDRLANQGHVANDIKKLVSCTLILPYERLVLYVAQFISVTTLYLQHVGQ